MGQRSALDYMRGRTRTGEPAVDDGQTFNSTPNGSFAGGNVHSPNRRLVHRGLEPLGSDERQGTAGRTGLTISARHPRAVLTSAHGTRTKSPMRGFAAGVGSKADNGAPRAAQRCGAGPGPLDGRTCYRDPEPAGAGGHSGCVRPIGAGVPGGGAVAASPPSPLPEGVGGAGGGGGAYPTRPRGAARG